MAVKTDTKKRAFLKHLSILGLGGLIGLGLARFSGKQESNIVEEFAANERARGQKIIWKDKSELASRLEPQADYSLSNGGIPHLNLAACAYHADENGDGKYNDDPGKYCSMPCQNVCQVDAITVYKKSGEKQHPQVNKELCIGCGKCFKICGYNALQWINER